MPRCGRSTDGRRREARLSAACPSPRTARLCALTLTRRGADKRSAWASRRRHHRRAGLAVSLSSVTVKAQLRGHDFDLQDLADLLPSGDTCVVKDVDGHYLTSAEIDDRPEGVPFYEVAPRVLRRVNGLARARKPNFEPVELNGHYTEGVPFLCSRASGHCQDSCTHPGGRNRDGAGRGGSDATAPRGTGPPRRSPRLHQPWKKP